MKKRLLLTFLVLTSAMTSWAAKYTLQVQQNTIDGFINIYIHGNFTPPDYTDSYFKYYQNIEEGEMITANGYPMPPDYGVHFFNLEDTNTPSSLINTFRPSSNWSVTFTMPSQDAALYAAFEPFYRFEVERGNSSIGTLELGWYNGNQPPTPTVNSNGNYEYLLFEGEEIGLRSQPAKGYNAEDIIVAETGNPSNEFMRFPYTFSNRFPCSFPTHNVTARADYSSYLYTHLVDRNTVNVWNINGQTVTPASRNGIYDVYYGFHHDKIDVTAFVPMGYDFHGYILNNLNYPNNHTTYYSNDPNIPITININRPWDAVLSADLTLQKYTLDVQQLNSSMVTNLRFGPPPYQIYSTDYLYEVSYNDTIVAEAQPAGGTPSDFVEYFTFDDGMSNRFDYAGPVATIPIPYTNASLMLETHYLPIIPNAHSLRVDRNTPNGTLIVTAINGIPAPPPSRVCVDYNIYYPLNDNDIVTLSIVPDPGSEVKDYSILDSDSGSQLGGWVATSDPWMTQTEPIYIFGANLTVTATFESPQYLEVKKEDINGNKLNILVNGSNLDLMMYGSYDENGDYYEIYKVNTGDEITVIAEPAYGYAVQDFTLYDDNHTSGSVYWWSPPTEGPLYPSTLTTARFTMPPMEYGLVAHFAPGYGLEVPYKGQIPNGDLTDVYRNGELLSPFGPNGANTAYVYYPIFENDVVIVRNVPDPGFVNQQYVLTYGPTVPFGPNIPPTTGTFYMPAAYTFMSAVFNWEDYQINITSSNGTTDTYADPALTIPIATAKYGDIVYIGFLPNTGYIFDSNRLSVTFAGGADAQPTILAGVPPYTAAASFVMQSPEPVNIVIDYPATGSIPGDVNGGGVTITDVTFLIDYLLGANPNPFDPQAADCNNDGVISILDVTALIDYLLTGHW